MNKIVILDRDGVINQDSFNYIKSVDEFIFLPGSVDAIVALTEAGYRIGIATNQSGVSRGYYDEQTLAAIHEKLLSEVRKAGGEIEAIEYCIHLPEQNCFCRKPKPGLLVALGHKLNSNLEKVPFIGDRVSDIQAAEALGAQPILIYSPMTDRELLQAYPHVPAFHSLEECVEQYLLMGDCVEQG